MSSVDSSSSAVSHNVKTTATGRSGGVTGRLALTCARRPRRTLAIWGILVVIALVLVVTSLKGLTSTGAVVGSTQSSHAQVLYNRVLGVASTERPTDVIVLSSAGLNVEDAGFQRFASRLIAQVRTNPGVTNVITDLHDIKPVVRAVRAASGQGGVSATVTGDHTADEDFISLSSHDLEHGELGFGLPVALVVLVLVFGAAVAALMPVFMALIAIAVGFGIAAILSHVFTLSVFIVNMMTGMGLALGIDYSLFVISRFREERAAGLDKEAAIQRAGATASRAVLFSGGTFTAALLGLLIVRVNVLRSLAAGAVIVGVVSVAAALTLLPAMLSIIGDRVNSLRLPIVGKHLGSSTAAEARIWTAFITAVPRRPAVSLILVGGIMVLAAAPVFGLHIGQSGVSSLPDNVPSKQGYLAMERYSRPRTPIPSRSRWRADRRSTAQTSRRSRGCSRATTGSDRVSSRPPRTARFWH